MTKLVSGHLKSGLNMGYMAMVKWKGIQIYLISVIQQVVWYVKLNLYIHTHFNIKIQQAGAYQWQKVAMS